MDKLPDNIVQLTTLQINRHKKKHCECYNSYPRKYPSYEIDSENREVICRHCKNIVDPFEALLNIAHNDEKRNEQINLLFKQAEELINYKPWLRTIKVIEKNVRGGEMIPYCPHCHKGILMEELADGFINKKRELERRKFTNKNPEV